MVFLGRYKTHAVILNTEGFSAWKKMEGLNNASMTSLYVLSQIVKQSAD